MFLEAKVKEQGVKRFKSFKEKLTILFEANDIK